MKNSLQALKNRKEKRKFLKKTIDQSSFSHHVERVCKDCGEIKKCDWMSEFNANGTPQYRARCKECHNKLIRKRRVKRWPYILKKKRDNQRIVKQRCVDYLGGKCCMCGYDKSIRALTFHHKNRKDKEKAISVMIVNNSFRKIKKELKKCVLVCFNRHMEIEEEYVKNNSK